MEPKRVYRSTTNKMIAGVCGGLAEYFRVDISIVRIIAVALHLFGFFPAFLAYFVLTAVLPQKPTKPVDKA